MREVLGIRDVRLLLLGQSISQAGDWLYGVALLVYVLEATGSAGWVAVAELATIIPWIVFGPLGGLLADRFDRRRVLIASDVAQGLAMVCLMMVAAAGVSPEVAIGVAGVAAVAGVASNPSLQTALPLLVAERRLSSVNAMMTAISSMSMIVGPAVAALLLVLGSPATAFGLNALTFAASATCVRFVRTPLGPFPEVDDPHAAGSDVPANARRSAVGRAAADLATGVRVLVSTPVAAALVLVAVAVMFAYGLQVVLWAVMADTKLGTGTDGLTLLYMVYGVGGLAATIPASRAASGRSAGAMLLAGAFTGALLIAGLAAVAATAPGLALVAFQGLAVTVTDVLVITLLQRSLGPSVLGRAIGAMDGLTSGAMVAGSALAPLLLATLGLEGGYVIAGGALFAAAAFATFPVLAAVRRGAERAESLSSRVRVLEALSLFAGAPRFTLEGLAAECREEEVAAGTVIIREGDVPDALYVLVDGSAVVTTRATGSEPINTMAGGDFFGEIGLLKRIPRTATVTASGACRLLRIDGETFLTLVNGGVTQRGVLGRSVGIRLARGRTASDAAPEASTPG